MESETVLGIDISQLNFYAALLKTGKKTKVKVKVFENSWSGFEQLQQWLQEQEVTKVRVCLEATSIYGHPVATYLHQQGHQVSIVNPARIKGFAQSQLSRTKNDQADATTIARFCLALKPQPWTPPAPELAKLQAYTRRLAALENMITQEKNRLKTTNSSLEEDIIEHITFLQQQVKNLKKRQQEHIQAHQNLEKQEQLLTSIVGIGEHTARIILSEIASINHFSSARQLAAFAGLTPQEHQSGTSVRGRTRLCKMGNPHLRKAFYFPALNAIRRCPQIQAFRERLLEAGKTKMQVVGALMHKLIRVVYGVLKSGQPFDPNKLLSLQPNCSADLA